MPGSSAHRAGWTIATCNQPFCDGSHKLAKGEAEGALYWYDETGQRHEVADTFEGIRQY